MSPTSASSIACVYSIAIAAVLASACAPKESADATADRAAPSPVASPGGATPAPATAAPTPATLASLRGEATRAYESKDFATCARLFLEAAAAAPAGKGSGELYDAACCLSRAGQLDEAVGALGRAIERGFADVEHLKADADLEPLRAHPRWKALVAEAEARARTSAAGQNQELAKLFGEDQADRKGAPGTVDWAVVAPRDAARRRRVREIVDAGGLKVAADYYHAAMVFQHGELEDFQRAHDLAVRAAELDPGHDKAKHLAASAMDRLLMSQGKPQRYGTQFVRTKDGVWKLHEVDPVVTDEERARWGVPPIAEMRRNIEAMNRK